MRGPESVHVMREPTAHDTAGPDVFQTAATLDTDHLHDDIKATGITYKPAAMRPGPQPVKTLLHTIDSDLRLTLRQAEYLLAVRTAVIGMLPDAAAEHVHVASVHAQQLAVHTDNTGWATRLRYAEPAIKRALAQQLRLHVDSVCVRVRPALARSPATPVQRRISDANRDYMHRVADYIDNTELAGALMSLAGRTAE